MFEEIVLKMMAYWPYSNRIFFLFFSKNVRAIIKLYYLLINLICTGQIYLFILSHYKPILNGDVK